MGWLLLGNPYTLCIYGNTEAELLGEEAGAIQDLIPTFLFLRIWLRQTTFFQPQFPCLENEDNNSTYFPFRIGIVLNGIMLIMLLEPCLEHKKYSVLSSPMLV